LALGRRLLALIGSGVLLFSFCAAAQAQSTLPTIEGESLVGQKVKLPEAAAGKVAVLVIGFSRASKDPTSAWAKRISAEFGNQAGIDLYQLPVLESVPHFIRGMVISSMRKGTPAEMREHFVPILRGEDELKKLVSFHEPDDAYLLVLDRSGRIVKQMHGPLTDESDRVLHRAVELTLRENK
jgi:hypothetical protein